MERLRPELLDDFNPLVGADANFRATLKGRGLYNTFHFVLRLSPAVHQKLGTLPNGIVTSEEIDLEGLEAFSTFLHETIHWWQHVGSTYGLMLSLTYPTQAHGNYNHLRNLIQQVGLKKSIRELAETLPGGGQGILLRPLFHKVLALLLKPMMQSPSKLNGLQRYLTNPY
jgi:hypothetical protein